MNRDDVIRMAREAGMRIGARRLWTAQDGDIERFAALVAAAEREKVAAWMMQRSYATGHGDTTEDLLAELDWQIAENWGRALIKGVEGEREACARICDAEQRKNEEEGAWLWEAKRCAAAIRARGNHD